MTLERSTRKNVKEVQSTVRVADRIEIAATILDGGSHADSVTMRIYRTDKREESMLFMLKSEEDVDTIIDSLRRKKEFVWRAN